MGAFTSPVIGTITTELIRPRTDSIKGADGQLFALDSVLSPCTGTYMIDRGGGGASLETDKSMQSICSSSLRFHLDGDIIAPEQTPAMLELNDKEQIDCMLQQSGCQLAPPSKVGII